MFLKLMGLPGWGQGTPGVSPWKEPAHVPPVGGTRPQPPKRRDTLPHGFAALLWAEPRTSCSIALMTQLIIISFAINLLVKRNSTHLLLINGALK